MILDINESHPDTVFTLDVISLVLSIIFMLDILLRILAQGYKENILIIKKDYFVFFPRRREFFHKKLEIMDLIVMTAGLIVNIVVVSTYDGTSQKKQAAK